MPAGPMFIFGLGMIAVFGFLLALFIAGLFLYLGATLVGIKNAGLLKSMVAVIGGGILGSVVASIVGVLFHVVPSVGIPQTGVAFVLTYIWVIKAIFDTDWLRAFLAWLMAIIIEAVVMGILVALGLVTMGALL